MTSGDWVGVIGIACTVTGGAWFIIMQAVDNKINDAMGKLKEDKIRDLLHQLDQERDKNDYLKEKIKDLK
jgi:hypothetical protein